MSEKAHMTEYKGQSFLIKVKSTQNHTWQGTVQWIEENKTVPVRSALELLRLLDSAVGTDKEEEQS